MRKYIRTNEFGIKVKKALLDKDMSARDLANELGICDSYMFEILAGTRKAQKQRDKISRFLSLK